MLRRTMLAGMAALTTPAIAQRPGPPHQWVFGMWIGGQFPPGDIAGAECAGGATVIFTRDIVFRATALDVQYRQRIIETVALIPDGLEFRFVPAGPVGGGAFGARVPPDIGFSCEGNPNLLRVRRVNDNEIVFPGCVEFPSALRRCVS